MDWHVTGSSTCVSSIEMSLMVTSPVFVTVKVYGMTSPAPLNEADVDVLVSVRAGAAGAPLVTVTESSAVTRSPALEVVMALAVLTMLPALRSACEMLWVPVHVVDAPAARTVTGQLAGAASLASLIVRLLSVSSPVFVTVNV